MVFPDGSEVHLGSFISSQAMIVGSFLYTTPLKVLSLFRTVCSHRNIADTAKDSTYMTIRNVKKRK